MWETSSTDINTRASPGPTKSWPAAGTDEWQWEVKARPDKKRAVVIGEFGGIFLYYPDFMEQNTWRG